MSTIPQHLAALEFYQVCGFQQEFYDEAILLARSHLKELIAGRSAEEMTQARAYWEELLLATSGKDALKQYVNQWRETVAKNQGMTYSHGTTPEDAPPVPGV